ncbi:phosphotransferase enzyme family protein [Streptomyces sp. Wb2n-11]|uniref:phosphotransferase enzyme family protein n=1 Tax=Streptomyces sp. Wb2n-11 TaxID=1030533 RepID=UPI000AE5BDEE|nr:phosphotransferase [Streptomyces sp. Wb2n-11]
MSAESDVMVVTDILPLLYRIVPTSVVDGQRGAATRNYLAEDSDGRRRFIKSCPAGADLPAEPEALESGEFARIGGVPVPAVQRSSANDLIVTAGGTAVSVMECVDGAQTAEGSLHGDRWAAAGEAVGCLHRVLARHPAGPPGQIPVREVCDVARAGQHLEKLLTRYANGTTRGEFAGRAGQAVEQRSGALPQVAAIFKALPPTLTAQTVHGDLASPDVLLREQGVAGPTDFRPPRHRSAAWEPGRIVLDPRTVPAGPDWPADLAEAIAAYREANPGLPVEDLLSVPRGAAGYMACSVYPLSDPVDNPAAVTPEPERYGRTRHAAIGVLTDRLEEAEGVLRDCLS